MISKGNETIEHLLWNCESVQNFIENFKFGWVFFFGLYHVHVYLYVENLEKK